VKRPSSLLLACITGVLVSAGIAQCAHAETDVLIFGHSQHFRNSWDRPYNQWNFGGGLEYAPDAFAHQFSTHGRGQWLVGAFALRDSIYQTGGAAYIGYRYTYALSDNWSVNATIRAGWIKDADYRGPAALPAIGITYKRVTIEGTFIPHISSGNKFTDPLAIVWARIRF